jgi:hypothetical protein
MKEFKGVSHLDVTPMVNHRKYYKWEHGGLLEVRALVSLVSLCMFMVCPCIKNVPTTH